MLKLSIVVPIYKVEDYLPACLDSILLPGREDYEIIAVDDGSPDRSGQIAEKYAARYPGLIRVIHQPNGGLGAARNTGIEAAKGDFLLFLDSDDSLFPGALEEMLGELARDEGCDVLLFSDDQVDEKGQVLCHGVSCAREGSFTLAEYPGLLLEQPSACTRLWRRRLFVDSGIRFPVQLWFEDLATTPRLFLRAGRMRAVPKSWLRYLLRGDSITNAKDPSRNREIITALSLVREDYRQQGALERYEKELEISAVKHQLLFSTTRVNQADPRSPLQKELKQDLDKTWPRWRSNPYLSQLPLQHRLLLKLIDGGHYGAVHAMMAANNRIKGKNA